MRRKKEFFCKIKLIFTPCQDNKYRPGLLSGNFLLYYGLVLLLLKLVAIPFLFYFPDTNFFADLTKTGLFEFSNSARKSLGIQPLKESSVLNTAAYFKARDMIEKGYFSHYSPEGISPWYWLERSGYNYRLAGENLAIGFLESEQVHSAWMNSLSHKKNILNPDFQEMGIAVLKDNFQGKETTLVVQFFGTQKLIIPEIPREEIILPPDITTEEPERAEKVVEITEKEQEKPETQVVSEEKKEEVVSQLATGVGEKPLGFILFQFMLSDYYNLIQKIIYGSLALIIVLLFVTIFCDIFIYRQFEIDYKDVVLKAVGFSVLWFVLLFLDKMIMIGLVNPQNFMIYPAPFVLY